MAVELFPARVPIGRVKVNNTDYLVYAGNELIRALRVVQNSVNAVESGLAASEIINVPAGGIASINVQDALNELDTEKAGAAATTAALALKAPLASPTFTGTPAGPTAAASTNTTQLATCAFVLGEVASAVTGLLDLKGDTDASANPNYPAASKGDAYYVTVAGKVGGASGKAVDIGDVYVAKADNAGGTEAAVGTSWFVLEHNLSGALLAANNLSDLTNAGTARSNLGLGSIATQAASNVSITGGTIGLASGSLGYATGNGGTVAQATSKSTGVTLDKISGQITMDAAALAAGTIVSFTLTNNTIAATDVLVLNHVSGGTAGAYTLNAQCAAGSASINVRNNTGGSLSEAIVIRFAVLRGATS